MASSSHSGIAQWSSQLAFTMAAIGCSVGLGNLWRFSAEAGSNGGAAFIVVYLLCVLCIGIPAIMCEFLIGRSGNASSAVNSMADLTTRSNRSGFWVSGVWAGTISGFLIASFYCVVAAWVMAYIPKFLTGTFDEQTPTQIAAQFDTMIDSPPDLMVWFLTFAALTTWLVSRGVNRGIEMASKILMPIFFSLLVLLSLYSVVTSWESGGTQQAFDFMFAPDFSKINGSVAVSALGQAFFSIGLGMAMMVTYGSYLPKNISIQRSAFIIGLSDTMVALIAGFAIFPIVFKYGLNFEAGAGLFFQTLPTALTSSPGGNLIGAAFFCMALFAALTTAVALIEPLTAHLSEQFKMSKAKSALIVGGSMTLVGFASLYSLEFMDFLDKDLTATLLLPFSALLIVSFVGWRLDKKIINDEIGEKDLGIAKFLLVMTRFVAPVMIAVILISGIIDVYL